VFDEVVTSQFDPALDALEDIRGWFPDQAMTIGTGWVVAVAGDEMPETWIALPSRKQGEKLVPKERIDGTLAFGKIGDIKSVVP
jgi:hypothetical protein